MSSCDAVLKTPENGQEGIQRIACPLFGCKRVYSDRSSLESHVKDHDIPAQSLPGKVLLCSTVGCSGSFPDMQKLMEHMRHHHKPNIFFLCESCRTKLRSYRGLLTHLHTCSKVTRAKKKQNEPVPPPTVAATNPNVVSPAVSTVNPPMNVVGAAMNVVNPPINVVSPALNVVDPPVNVVNPPVNVMNCPVTVMTPPVNMIPLPVNVTAESVNMAAVPMEVDASALDAAPAPQQLPSHPPNPDGPFPTMHPTDSAAPPNFAPLAPPQHFIPPNMTELAPQPQPQIGDQSFGQSPFPSAKDQMAAPDAPADQALHQLQTLSPDPPGPAEDSAPQSPPGSVTAWKKNPGLTCTRRVLWEHTKGRYTCVQCGHAVTNRKDMNHHIQTFHSGTKPADDNGGTV